MQRERSGSCQGSGQVNQKIARHTQNSGAQWNLNSARAAELNSLRPPPRSCSLLDRFPVHSPPRAVIFHPLSLSLSLGASYSLSFVIRKQTEQRSCQVGGVGDETAVSVRPSFLRSQLRTPHGSCSPVFCLVPPLALSPPAFLYSRNLPSRFPVCRRVT